MAISQAVIDDAVVIREKMNLVWSDAPGLTMMRDELLERFLGATQDDERKLCTFALQILDGRLEDLLYSERSVTWAQLF